MAISGAKKTDADVGTAIPESEEINLSGLKETSPIAVPNPERSALVDTKYLPVDKLKAHVEGSDWKTKQYHHQVLGTADEPKPLDLDLPASHQNYRTIKGLILKVTDPLEYDQDPETMVSEYVGAATIFYNLTPIKNDMFVAKIGDGQYGVFTITEVDRFSITKQSAFSIKYRMVNYYDDVYAEALEEKTIERLVYTPELEDILTSPFLTEEAHARYMSLDEYRFSITQRISIRMYDNRVSGAPIPDQDVITGDPYHTRFCNMLGLPKEHNKPFTLYHCADLDYEQVFSIWDYLYERNAGGHLEVIPKFISISTQQFITLPNAMSIAYSGYARVLYPHMDYFNKTKLVPLDYKLDFPERTAYSKTLPERLTDDFTKTLPMYHLIDIDDYYVLSKAFYETILADRSILEHLIVLMLENKSVSPEIVLALCDAWTKLDNIEQYYYGPMLILLIHYVEGS